MPTRHRASGAVQASRAAAAAALSAAAAAATATTTTAAAATDGNYTASQPRATSKRHCLF